MEVTVLMAVHNDQDRLIEAVKSIQQQTFEDWEFIIVDDASSDHSGEILHDLAKRDPRIKVLTNKRNLGLAGSLNRGILAAKGEFIARMDADDIAFPERLERQVVFMREYRNIDVTGSAAVVMNARGDPLATVAQPELHADIVRTLSRRNPFFHSSVMIRRKAFDRIGLYDERLKKKQDYELWIRGSEKLTYHNLQEALICYLAIYRKPWNTIFYGFRVRLWAALRYGPFFCFVWYAILTLLRSVLVKIRIYKPKTTRGGQTYSTAHHD